MKFVKDNNCNYNFSIPGYNSPKHCNLDNIQISIVDNKNEKYNTRNNKKQIYFIENRKSKN